jgi:hypothetical protein
MLIYVLWRRSALLELRLHLETHLKVPRLAQRYWKIVQRKNGSLRPDAPLVVHEDMVRAPGYPSLCLAGRGGRTRPFPPHRCY